MARLWQLMLVCWTWSPLCLSSSVSFMGSPQECEKARFVPGYNLGGRGFDIVTMQRKEASVIDTKTWNLGNGMCKMYRNLNMNGEKQKVPAAVVDWKNLPRCSLKVSATLYDSAETLVNDSTSAVSNNWKTGLDISEDPSASVVVVFGGSQSKASEFGVKKSKEDRYSFTRHSVDCQVYNYKMSTNPPLSHEFLSAVNSLPPYSSKTGLSYRNLIDAYGTHYITQVSLGGEIKTITPVGTCKASMSGLTAPEVNECLSIEASVNFARSASIIAKRKRCQVMRKKLVSGQSFSSEFNERFTEVIGGDQRGLVLFLQSNPSIYDNWVESLKTTPDVVQYHLKPLHTILPKDHEARSGLKQEVERYIKNNAVLKKCSESCSTGSDGRDACDCVCDSNELVESNCCPVGKRLATLRVYGLFAHKLYGDVTTKTDAFVKVTYGNQPRYTAIIPDNDNPKWKDTFSFYIDMRMVKPLKFRVYDEDTLRKNDLLGSCTVFPHVGTFSHSCPLNHGTFFFSYNLKCAPNLGGGKCDEYVSSPMNTSLAEVFYTRNGVLVGELEKMEVHSAGQSG